MSLHAELSPEALARLHAQRRNSTITSIVIALLTVVLVALILGVFLLPAIVSETPVIVTYESTQVEENTLEERKVQTSLDRRPSSPSSSMAKVITANTASPVSVPTPEVDVSAPSLDFGDGNDFGAGWGDGDGDGGGFGNIPPSMKKRCSTEDRLARLKETGGTPECETAVVKGLNWLKATQSADGSWTNGNKPAMTGLALLAFLGHCETPISAEYGDTVLRAITYLVDIGMKNNGKLTTATGNHMPYEHSIATYALAEAATFCKQLDVPIPNLNEVTRKAGQFIIDNQHERSGGWDYNYDTKGGRGGDLSVTAWHVQALKACSHTGLDFKNLERANNRAVKYINNLQSKDGGFGYDNANEGPHAGGEYRSMTGGGLLGLQMLGKGSSSSARRAARYIEQNTRFDYNTKYADLYGHYYEAQAMMNRGGSQWSKYNAMFRDQLLKNQNPDGGWKAPGGGQSLRAVAPEYVGNAHYRNCLNILMLEVYYRFLPGTGTN